METKDEDRIIETIKKVCGKEKDGKKYFNILKKIYAHISRYENEPLDNQAGSIKYIIDSTLGIKE